MGSKLKLSSLIVDRNNNFNILRLLAAIAVLVTHGFALVTGDVKQEPLREYIGITLGTIAVDAFFVTSGLLVTHSLLCRRDVRAFILSRVLRIVPGLFVMLLVTVFVFGLLVSDLTVAEYLRNKEIFYYFAKCLTLVSGVAYFLPGVFSENPYPGVVNGSLWTMPHEVRAYVVLLVLWVFSGWVFSRFKSFFKISILVVFLCLFFAHLYLHFSSSNPPPSVRLFMMFFCGASFSVVPERVLVDWRVGLLFLLSIISSCFDPDVFFVVYSIVFGYLVLVFSYSAVRVLSFFSPRGDYSYGIYIYAFPIQQLVMHFFPSSSLFVATIFSIVLTMVFAIASWHLVEEPALRLKGRIFKTSLLGHGAAAG